MSDELMIFLSDVEISECQSSSGRTSTDDSSASLSTCFLEESRSPDRPRTPRSPRLSTCIPHTLNGTECLFHLNEEHIATALQYFEKSARRWMSSGERAFAAAPSLARQQRQPSEESLGELLAQKERDLELAAKIGQSLLEHNNELRARTEFLEESLATSTDTVVQLKHELHKKLELLKLYSLYDDDGSPRDESTESLKKKLDRLMSENSALRSEASTLRSMAENYTEQERFHAIELSRQLDTAKDKIQHLQVKIMEKNEEYATQALAVEELLKEIHDRSARERDISLENMELNQQLDEAAQKQELLQLQVNELQEKYVELRGMFCEAEEELVRFRAQPPRAASFDSLYDSLASELENSDSGFGSSTPGITPRPQTIDLRRELEGCQQRAIASAEEPIEVPSSLLVDVTRKRINIDPHQPHVPPQTPASEFAATPLVPPLPLPVAESVKPKAVTCDAGTSTMDDDTLFTPPLATSTPIRAAVESTMQFEKGGILQFSEPLSSQSTPCTPMKRLPYCVVPPTRPSWFETVKKAVLPSGGSPLSKSESQDSLENYVAPKMGEPGVPGTRDLDYSLKMLKARRQKSPVARTLAESLRPPPYFPYGARPAAGTSPSTACYVVTRRGSRCAFMRRGCVAVGGMPLLLDAQVEKDYAQYCRRNGLPLSSFFSQKESAKKTSSEDTTSSWTDYSVILGQDHQRSTIAAGMKSSGISFGVRPAFKGPSGQGVLTRAEISSPGSSPLHLPKGPSFATGLGALLPSYLSSSNHSNNDFFSSPKGIIRRGL